MTSNVETEHEKGTQCPTVKSIGNGSCLNFTGAKIIIATKTGTKFHSIDNPS